MKSMCQDERRNSPSVTVRRPDVLLQPHGLADRVVLDGAQLLVVELAVRVGRTRVEQPLRAQQAADVVGAERRCVPLAHHPRPYPGAREPSPGGGQPVTRTVAPAAPR